MNILVEKKKEFTIRIINILSPLILEGITSIYNKAKETSTGDNVLKIFQSFLKRIPKWDNELILNEITRIKTSSKDYELLFDLIKATVKSNMHIIVYSPYKDSQPKINSDYYQNIDFNKFIHDIYIECAREIWNNPYLLYHNYPGIEIKRNQRDTIELIKKCIEESIRKTLPLKHVLDIYLGDDIIEQVPDNNFERTITEIDEKNLKNLLRKDLNINFEKQMSANSNFIANEPLNTLPINTLPINTLPINTLPINTLPIENKDNSKNNSRNNSKANSSASSKHKVSSSSSSSAKSKQSLLQVGGKESMNSPNVSNDLNSKILKILNNGDIQLSDNNTSDKKIEKNKTHKGGLSETSSENLITNTMDTNLQKLLKNDLGNSESEASVNFKPEKNKQGYQEVFSNSHNDTANTQEKNDEVNKNKFFNNYLQF
uniref:Uncharacterized protein n=1 Tax=viral metagenome TaxID=1070528 RepID=A0A6C0IYJ9_9ZZZZ